jgi:cyclophilin family peptidyl-prolyl cis-trans isomerase
MIRSTLVSLALLGLLFGAAAGAQKSAPAKTRAHAGGKKVITASKGGGEEVAVIETNMGNIVFRFFDKDAPKTAANFKKLAREGFYNGTTFHRVMPGFVIQGGDPNSKDSDRSNDGLGGPGWTVPAEIKRLHLRGAVATARTPDSINPNRESSGSQFFICLADLPRLDEGGYTVFGEVVEGMDVVDKIAAVKTDQRDNPVDPVVMKKVSIQSRTAPKPAAKPAP